MLTSIVISICQLCYIVNREWDNEFWILFSTCLDWLRFCTYCQLLLSIYLYILLLYFAELIMELETYELTTSKKPITTTPEPENINCVLKKSVPIPVVSNGCNLETPWAERWGALMDGRVGVNSPHPYTHSPSHHWSSRSTKMSTQQLLSSEIHDQVRSRLQAIPAWFWYFMIF